MSAPGETFLCEKGHLICWLSKGMIYEEIVLLSKEVKQNGCWCGRKAKYVFYHYEHDIVNDCLEKPIKYSRLRKRYKIKEKNLNDWNFIQCE